MIIYRQIKRNAKDSCRITIPIGWMHLHKLAHDSLISIEVQDDKLIIRPLSGEQLEAARNYLGMN